MNFLKTINLLILIVLVSNSGCKKDELNLSADCERFNCKNAKVTQELKDVEAKIIKSPNSDSNGDIYALDIDTSDFKIQGYKLSKDNILVPCQDILKDKQINNLRVIISGKKMDCCDILTSPNMRTGFGCLFIITSITTKQETK